MSDRKLNPIPRPASPPSPPPVDEWVAGKPPVPSADRTVIIKAAVSPALKRRLRMAAAAADTTVADVLRELAETWVEEQGF